MNTSSLSLRVMLGTGRAWLKGAGAAFLSFISGLAVLVTRSMAMNKRTTWKYGMDPQYLGGGGRAAPPNPT